MYLDIFPSFLNIDILFAFCQALNLIHTFNILTASPRGQVLGFCSRSYFCYSYFENAEPFFAILLSPPHSTVYNYRYVNSFSIMENKCK